jgi:ADP-heptose:LPS heptosyltransferase
MRKRFPTAEMHLMVGPWAREAAEMIPGPDRVIVHAPWGYRVLRAKREDWSLTPDFQMLRDMRRERYDLAVDLRGDLLTLLPMAFWGIPERVARATRGGRFALTRVVPPAPAGHEHETQRTLDVAAAVGASSPDCDVRVKVPPEAVKTAQCLLESTGLRPEKTVLFSPGAQSPIKRWPDANFGALARTLRADGLQAAVVGSSGDAGMAQEIVRTGEGVVDLTGKTNLKELTALAVQRICGGGFRPCAPCRGGRRERRGAVRAGRPGAVPSSVGPRARHSEALPAATVPGSRRLPSAGPSVHGADHAG